MGQRETIIQFLRYLADALERESAADVDSILRSLTARSKSTNSSGKYRERRENPKSNQRLASQDLRKIAAELRDLGSRNEGLNLLARANLSKKDLEHLARFMDLPVQREDDAERLKQKIVEASIGARLNSQAIIGE